jgi:hypothetical protein
MLVRDRLGDECSTSRHLAILKQEHIDRLFDACGGSAPS